MVGSTILNNISFHNPCNATASSTNLQFNCRNTTTSLTETSMDSIEECPLPSKFVVAVSMDAEISFELLSWAVGAARNPNDSIVAVHVLVGKDEKKLKRSTASKWRRAQAFVISLLGEFSDDCLNREVKLEAKVKMSSSVGKGLVDEALLIDANYLIIGNSNYRKSQRKSFAITGFCFKYAPEGCLVVHIGKQTTAQSDPDIDPVNAVNLNSSSTKSPRQKLFRSIGKKERLYQISHSSNESICEKSSPRTVLVDLEPCSSPLSSYTTDPGRKNIWRRLSSIKISLPFFNSSFDLEGKDTDFCSSDKEHRLPSWRCFSYEEIYRATNHFHPDNMVGRGGYSEVFRGKLCNGQMIAVKRLSKGNSHEHKEKEFLTELGILGHISHPNTASLIGCCIDSGFHLIFEFSSNGSLSSALHGKNSKLLEWPTRYKIAVGIAKGLHYLHKGCRRRIIHRDIKASNVLLGLDYEPQISDFGLAKWLPKQLTHHSIIPIEGTFGYLAPEYFMHGIVDEKTDIYAFGVLLLEIVTGRRPVDSSKQSLILWARPLIESGKIAELCDPKLEGRYDMEQLQRLVLIGSYCVRQSSVFRPSITEVLQLLTEGDESVVAESWRMQDCQSEIDDSSVDLDCLFSY